LRQLGVSFEDRDWAQIGKEEGANQQCD
jgi:hypothetical protein